MTVSGKRINISLYIRRQPPTVIESSLMRMQSMAVYGEKTSKKTIYSIEDNMFYFWYRFVLENMPIEFISLGRWWGNDPRKRSQTEIDIMGEQDSNSAIFAECKWKNDIVLIMGEFIYANMKKQRVIR